MQTTTKMYFGAPIAPLSEICEIITNINYPICFLRTESSNGEHYPYHIYMVESENSEPQYIYGDTLTQFFADTKPAQTIVIYPVTNIGLIFWADDNPQYRTEFQEIRAKRFKMPFPFKTLQSSLDERPTWRNDSHLWIYIADKHAPTDHAARVYLLFRKWQYMSNYCKSAK